MINSVWGGGPGVGRTGGFQEAADCWLVKVGERGDSYMAVLLAGALQQTGRIGQVHAVGQTEIDPARGD